VEVERSLFLYCKGVLAAVGGDPSGVKRMTFVWSE